MNFFAKAFALLAAGALCACAGPSRDAHKLTPVRDPVVNCERAVYASSDERRALVCADVLDIWQ